MKVKVFKIHLDPHLLEASEQQLNDFLETTVFKKSSTQFVEEDNSYWSVLVHYEESEKEKVPRLETIYFEDLNPKDQQTYACLKQWRAETANRLRLKSFMICHNSTLITMACNKPRDLEELKKIRGFGESKAEKYGESVLAILNAI